MQVTVNLKDFFHYSYLPILIFFILTLFLIGLYFLLFRKKKTKVIKKAEAKNIPLIKEKYLVKLDQLILQLNQQRISNRHAYQSLSNIIRNFVYEMINIQVQNYSLQEIERLQIPILTELVREYYEPEFSKISRGNILSSIEKTKEVIRRWN